MTFEELIKKHKKKYTVGELWGIQYGWNEAIKECAKIANTVLEEIETSDPLLRNLYSCVSKAIELKILSRKAS